MSRSDFHGFFHARFTLAVTGFPVCRAAARARFPAALSRQHGHRRLGLLRFREDVMATITWNNSNGGDWTTASDWTPNQVPGAGDDAEIIASGTYIVTITTGGVAVNNLTTAAGATVAIGSGDTLTVFGSQVINSGAIQIAAGSNNSELATSQAV